jgi:deoxyribonuclease V
VDVDYRDSVAVAAGVWFRGWTAASAEHEATAIIHRVAEYQPGEFYLRELPCLLAVLGRGPRPQIVIIDGYVWLGDGRPGLGAHLYEALDRKVAVVGVAKTRFASATDVIPICRGGSQSPLYVTAEGVHTAAAADRLTSMNGLYRMPTMLRRVDRLARTTTVGT